MKILALIIFCLLISFGCRNSSNSPAASSTPSAEATPATQLEPAGGGATPPSETKYFKGSIGSSLDLQMKLVRSGNQLSGSYFYQKVGTRIDLRGNVDKEGNLTLEEFDPSGKQTGLFKGIWKLNDNGLVTLAGNWSKAPGDKGNERKIAFSVHEQPISFTDSGVEVVSKQVKENNKKLKYEVTAHYPQLTGGNNPNFEKFNQAARSVVLKKVAGFKKDMAPEESGEPVEEQVQGGQMEIGYKVALAQDDLISVEFDVYVYHKGAAHPNSFSETINYDLKNGKQLRLSDLFKPGAKYLSTIAAYSIADLKKQMKAKSPDFDVDNRWIEEGAAAKAQNYESWTITKKGLGVHFDPYQVGPYAIGPQFVTVPYSTLKDLVNPEGPLAHFVNTL